MRKLIIVVAVLIMASLAMAAGDSKAKIGNDQLRPVMIANQLRASLVDLYGAEALASNNYVGSEFCLSCHTSLHPEMAEWRHTLHAFFIRQPLGMHSLQPGAGVMADFDKNSQDDFMQNVDFNALTGTAFDALKPNAPILSYDEATDQYFIQLGPAGLKMLVVATLGGQSATNGQRFMVRIPVADSPSGWSAAIYFSPLAWSGTAFTSNSRDWYTGNTPKYAPGVTVAQLGAGLQGQNYLKNCSGCHITGVRRAYMAAGGEYVVNPYPAVLVPENSPSYPDLDGDGLPDMINIGCESCHGPGAQHILARGDAAKIVNPAHITNNRERSTVCLQCHVRVASAPNKTWGFTYDETANKGYRMENPVLPLDSYQVSTAVKWPDGSNYVYARIDSYMSSDHYMGGHGIACNDCHNAHGETANPAQVRDKITRGNVADIPSLVSNGSFCLACHNAPYSFPTVTKQMVKEWDANFPAIRNAIEAHTHHPYGADRAMGLSNCITCHMAPGQSHTFFPAKPEDTIAYKDVNTAYSTSTATGNVNSCSASCHRGHVLIRTWGDTSINATPGDTKYGTAAEQALAAHLVQYYGPGGSWWDTTPPPAGKAKSEK